MRLKIFTFLFTVFLAVSQAASLAWGDAVAEVLYSEYNDYYFGKGAGLTSVEAKHNATMDAVRQMLLKGGYAPGKGFSIKKKDSVQQLFEDMLVKGKSDLIKGFRQ